MKQIQDNCKFMPHMNEIIGEGGKNAHIVLNLPVR